MTTFNCQLSIINYQLSIIHYQLSIIHYQLSIINYPLQIPHALMPVLALLRQVQVHLIAHKQLMAAVDDADSRSIDLVAIADVNAMEVATDKQRHRIGGTIRRADIHVALVVSIYQPPRHVGTIAHAVGAHQHRSWYS